MYIYVWERERERERDREGGLECHIDTTLKLQFTVNSCVVTE